MDEGPQLPHHGLADDEILSLLLLARFSPLAEVPHFSNLSQRAQNFILEHNGPEFQKNFQDYVRSLTNENSPTEPRDGQRLGLLIKATARQSILELDYLPESKTESRSIQFQPQQVVHSPGGWTVVGHALTDNRDIELRLSQITKCEDTEEKFEISKSEPAPADSLETQTGKQAENVHRPETEKHDVPRPYLQIHKSNRTSTGDE